MSFSRRGLWQVACLTALVGPFVLGCGGPGDQPDLGYVSGTVTLDDEPLEKAFVTFQPEGGRPSIGRTNEEGYYELMYTGDVEGAKIGKHVVSISTYEPPGMEGEEPTPEQVPVDYNTNAADNPEMNKEVKAGDNEFNFDLTTDGKEIVQPSEEEEGY